MVLNLLETIALALERRGIDYMIVGGQTVLAYGSPRFTADDDITVGLSYDGVSAIVEIIHKLGWNILVDSPDYRCLYAGAACRVLSP